jgi:hypothetical protein
VADEVFILFCLAGLTAAILFVDWLLFEPRFSKAPLKFLICLSRGCDVALEYSLFYAEDATPAMGFDLCYAVRQRTRTSTVEVQLRSPALSICGQDLARLTFGSQPSLRCLILSLQTGG